MDLTTWLNQGVGRRMALATACGMAPSMVTCIAAKGSPAGLCSPPAWMPRDRAPMVELFTEGAVRVEEMPVRLRPHERWIRVPDASYPLAIGRPVIASSLQPKFRYSQVASAQRISSLCATQ